MTKKQSAIYSLECSIKNLQEAKAFIEKNGLGLFSQKQLIYAWESVRNAELLNQEIQKMLKEAKK